MSHDDVGDDHRMWDELAAGAALYALEPDEQQAFDEHLAGCERCREMLAHHELTAAQLGTFPDADDAEAPPWAVMRSRIVGDTGSATTSGTAGVDEVAAARRRRSGRRALAAAAAVVVLAGGGIAAWTITQGPSPASCVAAAGCHDLALRSSAGTEVARLMVKNGRATVHPIALGTLPQGKAWVLWQATGSSPMHPLGSFAAAGPMSADLKAPFGSSTIFAVSQEPSGPMPTTPSNVVASTTAI